MINDQAPRHEISWADKANEIQWTTGKPRKTILWNQEENEQNEIFTKEKS